MLTEFLFIAFAAAVLYSLIKSTEKTISRRPQPVEKDVRIIEHRSRM